MRRTMGSLVITLTTAALALASDSQGQSGKVCEAAACGACVSAVARSMGAVGRFAVAGDRSMFWLCADVVLALSVELSPHAASMITSEATHAEVMNAEVMNAEGAILVAFLITISSALPIASVID